LQASIGLAFWAAGASLAFAHAGHPHKAAPPGPRNWSELARAWEFEPGVVIPLAVSAVWYGIGVVRMWRAAGIGRGVRRWEAACFAAGWLALVVGLVSPLHPWGSMLFSAHMVQHEVLMLVGAPLLVLGRPLVAFLKALPPAGARAAASWTRNPAWRAFWHWITNPFVAWVIHAVVLWVWHIPALFDATNGNDVIHALQHLSFVLSALLFWWAVMVGRHRATGYGAAVLYVFTTAMHSGLLGALITLAPSVWYPSYLKTTGFWGLTPLEDQQLGGLVMWAPACLTYIVAGLALFAGWMRDARERVERRESRVAPRPASEALVGPEPLAEAV
jgi:cytochrome c oxidase assembly factor CtaG